MDIRQFRADAPGRLVAITDALGNQGKAFLPTALPIELDLSSRKLRQALAAADRGIARLEGLARQIERPDLLFINYLRREALLSSKIEGTRITLAQLALLEAGGRRGDDQDASQVQNYVRAFEYGRERLGDGLRIGLRLLNEVHYILMQGSDEVRTTPGRIRDCTALIGSSRLHEARFVPPPHLHVRELIENLYAYLNDEPEHELLKVAIAHYQFETIHPYRDGNGRVGRLLISLYLQQQAILTAPMLYISDFFERRQQQYYDLLLTVSEINAWEPWLLFFLEAVATQAMDAIARTERLAQLRQEFYDRVRGKRASQALHDLIDQLFIVPMLSVPEAARVTDVTYPAARKHVDRLIQAQILETDAVEVAGTKYYHSRKLINAIEGTLESL